MKKYYIKPTTEVYKIETVGMLAMSFNKDADTVNPENSLGHESDADWDDEEY